MTSIYEVVVEFVTRIYEIAETIIWEVPPPG